LFHIYFVVRDVDRKYTRPVKHVIDETVRYGSAKIGHGLN